MTDIELLELAAKAADIYDALLETEDGFVFIGSYNIWNPLADDGDEARLESMLGLNVLWGARTVAVGRKHFGPFEERYQEHKGNKQAARRRAGVRAAAEIGRQMK
jgi:hypothetical protein